jgi:type II secretory pathway pseudopilin PulG
MVGIMIVLVLIAALAVLGAAAWMWGVDSRDPRDRDALWPR